MSEPHASASMVKELMINLGTGGRALLLWTAVMCCSFFGKGPPEGAFYWMYGLWIVICVVEVIGVVVLAKRTSNQSKSLLAPVIDEAAPGAAATPSATATNTSAGD